MDDLISRNALIDDLCQDREEGTFDFTEKQAEAADKIIRYINSRIEAQSPVPAVPLEPLARFIVENLDPRVDCESCVSDVENAYRDCRNCPRMSEEQIFDALIKWMEEQNEAD